MSLRQQNKARVRSNILEAAQELLAEQGVAATTTRQIAKRAGISYQTLYNYFPSKTELLFGILGGEISAWSSQVEACIKQYRGNLLDILDEINQIGLQVFSGDRNDLWREIGAAVFTTSSGEGQLQTLNQVAHERYHALLSLAQGTGELARDVDLHLLAHTLFCLTDYAWVTFLMSRQRDPQAVLQTLHEQTALIINPYLVGRAEDAASRIQG